MEAKTWDDCCKIIADRHNYSEWWHMPYSSQAMHAQEVAKLYADSAKKAYAEQAVKADREKVEHAVLLDKNFNKGFACMDRLMSIHENLPIDLS